MPCRWPRSRLHPLTGPEALRPAREP
jgi:hypothetical protein